MGVSDYYVQHLHVHVLLLHCYSPSNSNFFTSSTDFLQTPRATLGIPTVAHYYTFTHASFAPLYHILIPVLHRVRPPITFAVAMPVSHLGLTVSHIPSATSFYLGALQPLGYRYIGCQGDSVGLGIDDADFFITQGPRR